MNKSIISQTLSKSIFGSNNAYTTQIEVVITTAKKASAALQVGAMATLGKFNYQIIAELNSQIDTPAAAAEFDAIFNQTIALEVCPSKTLIYDAVTNRSFAAIIEVLAGTYDINHTPNDFAIIAHAANCKKTKSYAYALDLAKKMLSDARVLASIKREYIATIEKELLAREGVNAAAIQSIEDYITTQIDETAYFPIVASLRQLLLNEYKVVVAAVTETVCAEYKATLKAQIAVATETVTQQIMSTQIKHFTSAPEALTDSQIGALFSYSESEDKNTSFWTIKTEFASWELIKWSDSVWGLYLGSNGVKAWNEHEATHTEAQIIREAYEIIYKQSL